MRETVQGSGHARVLIGILLLGATLLFFAGCTAPAPQGGQESLPTGTVVTTPSTVVTTPTGIQSKMVHIAGKDRGVLLLVGKSTCPWCVKTKALLANLSVDYYWVDLNTLDQAETTQVTDSIKVCGQTSSVPILVINGERCIIGYQEAQIREAVR